jgi:ubiquinone/menaquinone biosynthesis C-methylase UbiE
VSEFTGERVIPGEVNDDLWAEHVARYTFAARFAANRRVLDIGSGAGYGVAELSHGARTITGIDSAQDAVGYAREHYTLPNVHFVQASATALPFKGQSFDLATAFEVIEHLADWPALLAEARRVLCPGGLFLVSTPNKLYYAESRAKDGPNPFHVHEFEFAEFRDALNEYFPSVSILLQNRLESFSFCPHQAVFPAIDARIDGTRGSPADAHFFVAICANGPAPELRSFLYVPRASNLLRERERHIQLLSDELTQTKQWLAEVILERQQLIRNYDDLTLHVEEQNRWARQLEKDWKAGLDRIGQLQNEFAAQQAAGTELARKYDLKVSELEEESRQRTQWALGIESRFNAKAEELAETVRLLDRAEATVVERTLWAQQLQARLKELEALLQMIRDSGWNKLGRALHLGPQPEAPQEDR